MGYNLSMKKVTSVGLETFHRGVLLNFATDGEPVALQISKFEARQMALRLLRMLGTKRGEGEG